MKIRNISKTLIILLCVIALPAIYLYLQNNWIQIENINIEIKDLPHEIDGFKIAHVSDLHLPKNASDITKTVKLIKKQNPDIIVMTGDLVDQSIDLKDSKLDTICIELRKICNVYAVSGNHESRRIKEWKQVLKRNDIKVIDNDYIVFKKNNEMIAIMGLSDAKSYSADIYKNIKSIKNMPRLLLAHRPELFPTYYNDKESIRPDLVFCGHAHGGQFRIPFIGGLYSPSQGYFPKLTSGVYVKNSVSMVVSRGLGNSVFPIRINNRPHLPIVTLNKSY